MAKTITQEQIKEFEKLCNAKVTPIKNKPNLFNVKFANGKAEGTKRQASQILDSLKRTKQKRELTFSNLSQLFKEPIKKPKTKWCIASCGLTEEDYSKLKGLAKKYNQTVNRFIKALLLKVIESNN